MEIEIYNAELQDIPWLLEQAQEFSKFSNYKKKQLYPGDEYAAKFFENLINTQIVFMAKALKKGYAYNQMLDQVFKITEEEPAKDGKPALLGMVDIPEGEDPWIRTGFIAGYLFPHFFNPDIITLAEIFWWVPEKHRRGRSGHMLFNFFKAFGEDNADHVYVSLHAESPVQHRFMTKKGFKVKEFSFLMEV